MRHEHVVRSRVGAFRHHMVVAAAVSACVLMIAATAWACTSPVGHTEILGCRVTVGTGACTPAGGGPGPVASMPGVTMQIDAIGVGVVDATYSMIMSSPKEVVDHALRDGRPMGCMKNGSQHVLGGPWASAPFLGVETVPSGFAPALGVPPYTGAATGNINTNLPEFSTPGPYLVCFITNTSNPSSADYVTEPAVFTIV